MHLHDKIYNLCEVSKGGNRKLVDSIPVELANELRQEGLAFTNADRYADGTYVPLPNVSLAQIEEYYNSRKDLEEVVQQTQKKQRVTRSSTPTKEEVENKRLSNQIGLQNEQMECDRKLCKLRYTCEVAFSRVTKTRGLRDVISNDFFPFLDDMNHWGHARVNLDAPLMA